MKSGGSMLHSQGLSNNPSWAESTQFPALIPISSMSILIMFSHLRLGLPKGLFPVGLQVKIVKAVLPSSILSTCPAHLNLLDLITLTILCERYKLWSSSLWSLLHSPFASLLGPNIRLRILFSNTHSLHTWMPYTGLKFNPLGYQTSIVSRNMGSSSHHALNSVPMQSSCHFRCL